ncbi:MAG: polysaccharide deacetylase family protein [Oscillospiraceae bacterium]|nr:polysaccharide deacetylase family protein [Oscillospiraceae bacterium]
MRSVPKHMPFLLTLASLCLLLIIGLAVPEPAVETGSWGLSFPTPGEIPQAPVSAERLRPLDSAFCDIDGGKVLYLTFDAGYENGYTAQMLDVLKAHEVPATFFLVGTYIEKNPDLVRRMAEEGHTVGNHTQNHPDMSRLNSLEAVKEELKQVEDAYFAVTGSPLPKYYRPPQGIYSEENLRHAQALGYKTVFWSLAYADWDNKAQPSAETAFSKLLPRLHDGAVILLHATSRTNAVILEEFLTRCKNLGYRFAPIDELFL